MTVVGTGPPPPGVGHPPTSAVGEALRSLAGSHKHVCPRQVLGVRAALYAGQILRVDLPQADKRLVAFIETDGCLADGISVVTGCSLGHRTMRLVDYGKTAATFVDTEADRAVRIAPHTDARRRADEWAPAAPSRWHAQLEAYQEMPNVELLVATRVALRIDLPRLLSTPGKRVVCVRCREDVINEREVLVAGQPVCLACAHGAYYRID